MCLHQWVAENKMAVSQLAASVKNPSDQPWYLRSNVTLAAAMSSLICPAVTLGLRNGTKGRASHQTSFGRLPLRGRLGYRSGLGRSIYRNGLNPPNQRIAR